VITETHQRRRGKEFQGFRTGSEKERRRKTKIHGFRTIQEEEEAIYQLISEFQRESTQNRINSRISKESNQNSG